jgi:hypothetical protein
MAKPRMSVTKRQREQKKRDRQQMKSERKAQRGPETEEFVPQRFDEHGMPLPDETERIEEARISAKPGVAPVESA